MTGDEGPVPMWLRNLADAARTMDVPEVLAPPSVGGRRAAVLVLLAEGAEGPDILLIERSENLRLHAGEAAFPGGALDDSTDDGPVATALREATEEVGIDPRDVDVVATLPELYIPPTDFRVVPVLGWWRRPQPPAPKALSEVAAVERVGMRELADPGRRLMLHRPQGIVLPAFDLDGRLIWGMTATVIDRLLFLAGWERPWSPDVVDWD